MYLHTRIAKQFPYGRLAAISFKTVTSQSFIYGSFEQVFACFIIEKILYWYNIDQWSVTAFFRASTQVRPMTGRFLSFACQYEFDQYIWFRQLWIWLECSLTRECCGPASKSKRRKHLFIKLFSKNWVSIAVLNVKVQHKLIISNSIKIPYYIESYYCFRPSAQF